jgi:predicted transglutaminase-like cysteine proteinase
VRLVSGRSRRRRRGVGASLAGTAAVLALLAGAGLVQASTGAPPACREAAGGCRVPLTPALARELDAVQREVNAVLRPASDREAFGLAEHWTPIAAPGGRGDCEDFALTKLHRLLRQGWPRDALRLTLATLPDAQEHLVLAVRTDRSDYVLDNLRPAPVLWTALPYRWRAQETPGSAAWRAIATPSQGR